MCPPDSRGSRRKSLSARCRTPTDSCTADDHSHPECQEDHSDHGPEGLAGHERPFDHSDSLQEPHTADDAQQDSDESRVSPHVCDGLGVSFASSNDLVDVAPVPVLAGFERLDERVSGLVEVSRGVLPGRLVTAADVTALRAPAEVNPPPAREKAFDAAVAAGLDVGNEVQM